MIGQTDNQTDTSDGLGDFASDDPGSNGFFQSPLPEPAFSITADNLHLEVFPHFLVDRYRSSHTNSSVCRRLLICMLEKICCITKIDYVTSAQSHLDDFHEEASKS
jgi:hypothetical protein